MAATGDKLYTLQSFFFYFRAEIWELLICLPSSSVILTDVAHFVHRDSCQPEDICNAVTPDDSEGEITFSVWIVARADSKW